jgi:hypothetical protein
MAPREAGTHLCPPSPHPTLSKFGKGTPSSTTRRHKPYGLNRLDSRLRASLRNRSTMARSPLGVRRPPASRRTTVLLLSRSAVGHLALKLTRFWVKTEVGERRNGLGFRGSSRAVSFCPHESHTKPLIRDEWLMAL